MVFIDCSKAFDSIHRDHMFQILSAYGIPESIIKATMRTPVLKLSLLMVTPMSSTY